MNNLKLCDLLVLVNTYSPESIPMILKAYHYAEKLHKNQFRQSGEPYIIHPLNVAYTLAEIHADCDTICAGLLHDVIEDTDIEKEDIALEFNQIIADLVDGVTKMKKMNFSSKQAQNLANTRKIITSMTEDVRIIFIKLADRLHNMRTLQYKSEFKQKENALETMEIFVPLAYYLGAYRIKSELEDLSLKYLKPDAYKSVEETKLKVEEESKSCLQEMLFKIESILEQKEIPNEIKVRTKNIYGIYKRLENGDKICDIHDLLALKIMVEEVEQCYLTLGYIHAKYPPMNEKFKDYICNPKTNMYQSLHTTVFGAEDRLVQTQIRTFDMDKTASFGLTAYWDINKGQARNIMQKELKEKFQFFKSLTEINHAFSDNQDFVNQIKAELFANKVYVYTPKGDIIELPVGSTPVDFAYKIHTNIGHHMVVAVVNDMITSLNYALKNKDRVKIITDYETDGPNEEWIEFAKTTYAKRKIKEYIKSKRSTITS